MHNELTMKDIQMMREELDYRRIQLRPQLLEAVKEARAFGISARTSSTRPPSRRRTATRAASASWKT